MRNFIQVKRYGATVHSRIHIDHIITYVQQYAEPSAQDGVPNLVRIVLTSGITFIGQASDAEIDALIREAQR